MKIFSICTKLALAHFAIHVSIAGVVSAAEPIIPQIEIQNIPLVDAIKMLAQQADFNFVLDPQLPRFPTGPTISARWTNVTAQAALGALLKEHKLTMVTSPATTVTRIAPADLGVKPVPPSQVGTNTSDLLPLVVFDSAPIDVAIDDLATKAHLKVSFAPMAPTSDHQGVSFRWRNITARQALAALLDNYGLVMTEDSTTSTARISVKPKSETEIKKP